MVAPVTAPVPQDVERLRDGSRPTDLWQYVVALESVARAARAVAPMVETEEGRNNTRLHGLALSLSVLDLLIYGPRLPS